MDNDKKSVNAQSSSEEIDKPSNQQTPTSVDEEADGQPGLSIASTELKEPGQFKTKQPKQLLVWLILVVVLIILVIAVVIYLANRNSTHTSSLANNPGVTDIWTGKGNDQNWSNASNWNNGIPKAGDNIEFDLSNIANYGSGKFVNDIKGNPVFNELILSGSVQNDKSASSSTGPVITGDALTLTGGINDLADSTTFNIKNPLDLSGSQTVSIGSGNGSLMLDTPLESGSTAQDNFGTGTITLKAADNSVIFLGNVAGPATLLVDDTNPTITGSVQLPGLNPGFTGKIIIQSGLLTSSPSGLGKNQITIDNGAALSLTDSSASYTINNPITMSGSGLPSTITNNSTGVSSGAVYFCENATSALCAYPQTVNFAAQVTLTGDTQLGIDPEDVAPSGPTINYTFSNLVAGKYTVSGVPSSGVSIGQ